MRFVALAADYDGTLAHDGVMEPATVDALARLRASGRELILVTGRELSDLAATCPCLDLFSIVVAENGAVLYWPSDDRVRLLGDPPPPALVEGLRARNVDRLSVGHVIVALWHPHEVDALETIRELGLEHQLIFNKGAVMILPPGVNKATGLAAALDELRISPHNVVGVGDAENDHSLLRACECAVAVANALPTLQAAADFVTVGDHGAGVVELAEELMATDLTGRERLLHRHDIPIGTRSDGQLVTIPSHDAVVLVTGLPTSGKSMVALGLMERLTQRGHQLCVVDPEGDYESFGEVRVEVRRATHATSRVLELLDSPHRSVCIDLLGVSMQHRPRFGADLLAAIEPMLEQRARPHWLVLDEAHHVFPFQSNAPVKRPSGLLLVTADINSVSRSLLREVDYVIGTGPFADQSIRAYYASIDEPLPSLRRLHLNWGEALVSVRRSSEPPFIVTVVPTRTKHRRHRRKYDIGDVGHGRGFYFRDRHGHEVAYARNLSQFVELVEHVEHDVWLHHLDRGDFERWLRDVIKDDELAEEVTSIREQVTADSALDRRALLKAAIIDRYAGPS